VGWFQDTRPPRRRCRGFARCCGGTSRKPGQPIACPAGSPKPSEWKINDQLAAFGRKCVGLPRVRAPGIRASHLLMILDEACGIPKQLGNAAAP